MRHHTKAEVWRKMLRVLVVSLRPSNCIRLLAFTAISVALTGCGDRAVTLFGGLSETEANRLVAYLDSQGLKSQKVAEREGTAVTVAARQLPLASRLANQAGLPRGQYKGLGTVFTKDGLISSPLEERARLTFAISQELEAMLTDIPGVLGARVNVVIPERRNGHNTDLPSAAVLIKYRSDVETDLLERKVRRLVASSVPGLVDADERQIGVTFMPVGGQRVESPTHDLTSPIASAGSLLVPTETSDAMGKVADTSTVRRAAPWMIWICLAAGFLAATGCVAWILRGQIHDMLRKPRSASSSA